MPKNLCWAGDRVGWGRGAARRPRQLKKVGREGRDGDSARSGVGAGEGLSLLQGGRDAADPAQDQSVEGSWALELLFWEPQALLELGNRGRHPNAAGSVLSNVVPRLL